ncbi:MAG: AhpC/TSA family protein [Acidobacteriota bacterium]|nr:AhpC/TSA family protein [Acidobacteriota bacterium]
MLPKILSLSLMICALCFNVHSQESAATGIKTPGSISGANVAGKSVSADEAAKNALNVGAKMPSFSLKDANGKVVGSDDLLKQGNLVVVFYRGSWCPFCNLYLRNLQKNLPQIKEAGGNLVAVSVENPDNSLSVAKKNELDFTVLSDPNLNVARKFGIVYGLPKKTAELYKSRGLDVAEHNRMEKAELPLSATYVVNQKGKIVYAFLEPDYKKRAESQVIIEMLSKIKSSIVKLANIANITVAPIKVK